MPILLNVWKYIKEDIWLYVSLLLATLLLICLITHKNTPNSHVIIQQGNLQGSTIKPPSSTPSVAIPVSGTVTAKVVSGKKVTTIKKPATGTTTVTDDGNNISVKTDFVIEPITIEAPVEKRHAIGYSYYNFNQKIYYKYTRGIFNAGIDYNITDNQVGGWVGVEVKF